MDENITKTLNMSSNITNTEGKGNNARPLPLFPPSGDGNKVQTSNSKVKASDLDRIRQNLVMRSMNVKFDLEGSQYKSIENIGAGAYGVVCSAVNKKTGDKVAIKKTSHVFEVLTIAKRTYREIKILKHFKHDNIIKIRDILLPKEDVKSFADIYIVFDLMESDLHHIIYSKQVLSEEHIRYFLYQILRGLKYIHSANVVHRDLKPSNLLVNEDCHLRIGDFGMARGITYTPDEPNYLMTQYVATRWYRAPEILLSMIEYDTAVDMWSVGCIFAEMMGRKHLFPGKDYISQVKLILGVLGTPSDAWMRNCQNDILKRIIKSFGKKPAEPWEKVFPNASRKSIDLLSKMLKLNPAERISVDQALSHRLLNHYHDPDDEPICVPAFNFDFENKEMDMNDLRKASMKEIMDFHQPNPPSLSFPALLRPAPKGGNNEECTALFTSVADENDSVVNKKDIVFTAIDKDDFDLKPVVPSTDSTFDLKNELQPSSMKPSPPVFVDTSKSQLDAPLSDIEMLSARSNNGMMDFTTKLETAELEVQVPKVEGDGEKKGVKLVDVTDKVVGIPPEKKEGVKPVSMDSNKKGGGNTISEDTKALVKQALLNATNRRQREPPEAETEKAKPVTAAQRQKEREEKRKKKKEKALEKGKKAKTKAVTQQKNISLSNEDLEMLRRWTSMQFPAQNEWSISTASPPDPSTTPLQNNNTAGNSINNTISANTNSNSTVALTMIPTNTFSNLQTQSNKQSNECSFAIKNSKKFRQILSKSSVPSSNVTQASNVVNVTSDQTFTGGSVMLSSSQLNLSMTNFIPVLAIPSTTNPGNMEIKRIIPPLQQQSNNTTTTTSSTQIISSQSSTINQLANTSSSSPSASDKIKSNLQKGIMRRASGSALNAQNSSSSSTNSTSSNSNPSASSSQFPSVQECFHQDQSLFIHHRHSTGSMHIAGQSSNNADNAQQQIQRSTASENSKRNLSVDHSVKYQQQQQPPPENDHFNSTTTDFNMLKNSEHMSAMPSFSGQQNVDKEKGTVVQQQHSPQDILDLFQQSPNTFDALIDPPQVHQGLNNKQTSLQEAHTPPPPPYPFHRSPQQLQSQSSSPSSNHTPFSIGVENSPQSNQHENPPSYAQTLYETFQANSPENPNTNTDTIPIQKPFLSKHHSEPQIVHNYFNDLPGFNDNSNNQSEFNIQNPSFVRSTSSASNFRPKTNNNNTNNNMPTSYYDHSMDHQQSQPALPFQNYQQHQQQHQQQNGQLQFQQQQQLHHQDHQQQNLFDTRLFQSQQDPHKFDMNPVSVSSTSVSSPPSFAYNMNENNFSPTQQQQQYDGSLNFVQQQQQQQHNQQQPNQQHQHQQQHGAQQLQHRNQQQNLFQQQQHNQFSHQHQNQFQQQQHQHQNQQQDQQQHLHQQQQQPYHQPFNTQQQPQMVSHLPTQQQQSPHSQRLQNTQPSGFVAATNPSSQLSPSSNYLTNQSVNSSPGFGAAAYPSTSGHKSKSPQLTIDTQKDNSSDGSNPSDLIAMLTKQLSKSAVVDAFPPALAVTPRGTGAGYGVGMDLDAMLTDAQDHASMRVEQSPLSSSLIADWLAVSGAISQADIEALERELVLPSPMNVSYNDNFQQ